MLSKPLIATMGPLSRLIAHCIENVSDVWLVQSLVDDLKAFSHALAMKWRDTLLSSLDRVGESRRIDDESMAKTIPQLWKLLRSVLFASTILLRAVLGRVLNDSRLARDNVAPDLAIQSLYILRDLYFITSRVGSEAFSQYTFVYLTALDILNAYPPLALKFLEDIQPPQLGRIPSHALDRNLDLYFLNTAEHFTLILAAPANQNLLVAAAMPYLATGGKADLVEIFEAAHSVILSVLCAPQSADIAAKHLPIYIGSLFSGFPQVLSPRQFRLAFKTLVRIASPPSPLATTHPDLPETLLEMLHHRALSAPTHLLPSSNPDIRPLDERTTLILTLIDSLPFLPPLVLEEWLPLAADLLGRIDDASARQDAKEHLWEGAQWWRDGRGSKPSLCGVVGHEGRARGCAVCWRGAGRDWSSGTRAGAREQVVTNAHTVGQR
ncbi:hypothetical protein MRB53_039415 [Persea americana]|nr:hypothetical protein MRB53_039415 [Persea americana]